MADNAAQSIQQMDRQHHEWQSARDRQFVERGWAIYAEKYDDEHFLDGQNLDPAQLRGN